MTDELSSPHQLQTTCNPSIWIAHEILGIPSPLEGTTLSSLDAESLQRNFGTCSAFSILSSWVSSFAFPTHLQEEIEPNYVFTCIVYLS